MQTLDWLVMLGTLTFIVVYGILQSRKSADSSDDFLAGKRTLQWWTIGLSIMATQASAITFLSTPGQGFNDGLQFAQFYFGMPIAMIILSITVLPVYYRLKITTAYEYLEDRFDLRMRTLTAVLFLIQRGVAAAISIYAPSIILSAVFGWNLSVTNFLMAVFVIFYTALGGSGAVSRTQELQMSVMLGGLVLAFVLIYLNLPEGVGLTKAWEIAGITGKTQIVDWGFPRGADGQRHFDWNDRYNFWSGILGATFLFLSYFGTDQSQVGRYLSGRSLRESRFGLLFNGFIKIPMQLLVLSVGVMVFVFFQFNKPPLYFDTATRAKITDVQTQQNLTILDQQHDSLFLQKQAAILRFVQAENPADEQSARNEIVALEQSRKALHAQAGQMVEKAVNGSNASDKDYVFIHYILNHMPAGLIGLMLAMIFCASWSTTASELTALSATTVSDIYRRSFAPGRSDQHYFRVSRIVTICWGAFIIVFASYANLFDNLIQAVNMVGSIFYGTVLGIFMTAFFLRYVRGTAVFLAAIVAQIVVVYLFFFVDKNPYLWYNPLGCFIVMLLSSLFQRLLPKTDI